MSKIVRINNGDYKLSVQDPAGIIQLETTSTGNIKLTTPDVIVDGGKVSTTRSTISLFDNVATTVTSLHSATDISFGNTAGIFRIHNASVILDGDLAVNGGDLTSTSTTFNLLSSGVTTVHAFNKALAINIGDPAGIVTIAGNLEVQGSMTTIDSTTMTVTDYDIELGKDNSNILSSGGIILRTGADPLFEKSIRWYNSLVSLSPTDILNGVAVDAWNSNVDFNLYTGKKYIIGNIPVLTSTTILPNATTVTAFGSATNITIGSNTGTATLRNQSVILSGDLAINGGDLTSLSSTFNLLNTNVITATALQAATNISIGNTVGTCNIHNASVVLDGDLSINGGDLTSTSSTVNILINNNTINIGNASSAIYIPGSLHVGSLKTSFTETSSSNVITTSMAPVVVDSFDKLTYRSAKYLIQMSGYTSYHTCEISVIHDGTAFNSVQILDNFVGSICGTFISQLNNNDIELVFTPIVSNVSLIIVKQLIII